MRKNEIMLPTPSSETKAMSEMTNIEISEALTIINKRRKILSNMEKAVKDHIKKSDLDFDDTWKAEFGNHRISKHIRYTFDKDRFKKEATIEEIDFYNSIQKKYQKGTEVLKI